MPQMAPMNWFMMSLIFIMILIVNINKVYHLNIFYSTFNNSSNNQINEIKNIWKW